MTEVVLTKQKVESGKTERLREWMNELQNREDEAIETLQSEGMYTESAFLEQSEDGDFLVYFMEAEDLQEMYESFQESTHEIDEEHKQAMDEVIADDDSGYGNYELLYHLSNPERP